MKILTSLINLNKWVKLFSGSFLCAVLIITIVSFKAEETLIVRNLIIPLAVPGAFALMGLLEVITGVPFREISSKWDSLAGWQRGILGTIVAIISFVILMFGIVLFA